MDPGDVDQAVGGTSGVGRSAPLGFVVEEAIQLVELDVDISVEVDERDPFEHGVVGEDIGVEQCVDGVGSPVVVHARPQHRSLDRIDVEASFEL